MPALRSADPFKHRNRRAIRFAATTPARLRPLGAQVSATVQLADISEGGLGLRGAHALPSGTRVLVDFDLSGKGQAGALQIGAEVVWSRHESLSMGLRFAWLTPDNARMLMEMVRARGAARLRS